VWNKVEECFTAVFLWLLTRCLSTGLCACVIGLVGIELYWLQLTMAIAAWSHSVMPACQPLVHCIQWQHSDSRSRFVLVKSMLLLDCSVTSSAISWSLWCFRCSPYWTELLFYSVARHHQNQPQQRIKQVSKVSLKANRSEFDSVWASIAFD